jgi:DNA-binding MarR family transcriptional regulator
MECSATLALMATRASSAQDAPTRQPRTEDSPAEEVQALMDASKVVAAAIAHSLALADAKVTLPQLRVLIMVRGGGSMNMSAVAEGLGVNPSNASRTCDRLVRGGLLARREDPHDRRNVALTLRAPGRRLVEAMLDQRQAIFAQVVQEMSATERTHLVAGLTAFNQAARLLSTEGTGVTDGNGQLLRSLS